jgi:hypothetical protein
LCPPPMMTASNSSLVAMPDGKPVSTFPGIAPA